jgi:hypothetical protein
LVSKISEQIHEKFYQSFVDKIDLSEILDTILLLTNDLYLVYTKVVPCFPPKYNIFTIYKDNYLKHIYDKIKPFMNEEVLTSDPGRLILIAKWLDKFEELLRKVGVDIKATEISTVSKFVNLFLRMWSITCIYSMIMLQIY